jgi:hypothetical protein
MSAGSDVFLEQQQQHYAALTVYFALQPVIFMLSCTVSKWLAQRPRLYLPSLASISSLLSTTLYVHRYTFLALPVPAPGPYCSY